MSCQSIFKRYEYKYLISLEQKERIVSAMAPYMEMDTYGLTTVRNVYYDTDNFRLIRQSIEKPMYKEKLRIRSYDRTGHDGKVFVELKKKYRSIVYKRRIALSAADATEWLSGRSPIANPSQISNEIEYFVRYYGNIKPKVFLSYNREAYRGKEDKNLRITFDSNIIFRQNSLPLDSEIFGKSILDDRTVLMEIKCSNAIPLWTTKILSAERIFRTSFSKYGKAYSLISQNHTMEESQYVKNNIYRFI